MNRARRCRPGSPGFVAAFADGKARFIRHATDEATIRALVTRNGGEAVDLNRFK